MHLAIFAAIVLGIIVLFHPTGNVLGDRTTSTRELSPSPSPETRTSREEQSPSPSPEISLRSPSPSPVVLRSPSPSPRAISSPSPIDIENPDLEDAKEVEIQKENIRTQEIKYFSNSLESTKSGNPGLTIAPNPIPLKSPEEFVSAPVINTVSNILGFFKSIFFFKR